MVGGVLLLKGLHEGAHSVSFFGRNAAGEKLEAEGEVVLPARSTATLTLTPRLFGTGR